MIKSNSLELNWNWSNSSGAIYIKVPRLMYVYKETTENLTVQRECEHVIWGGEEEEEAHLEWKEGGMIWWCMKVFVWKHSSVGVVGVVKCSNVWLWLTEGVVLLPLLFFSLFFFCVWDCGSLLLPFSSLLGRWTSGAWNNKRCLRWLVPF